jgi:hypothetical protein
MSPPPNNSFQRTAECLLVSNNCRGAAAAEFRR